MPNYSHVTCQCGGIIGMYNRDTFNCEQCGKEHYLYALSYDYLAINDKTGWIFPVTKRYTTEEMYGQHL